MGGKMIQQRMPHATGARERVLSNSELREQIGEDLRADASQRETQRQFRHGVTAHVQIEETYQMRGM